MLQLFSGRNWVEFYSQSQTIIIQATRRGFPGLAKPLVPT